METTVNYNNGKTVITINGRLDTEQSMLFAKDIEAIADGQLTLVDIDCTALEYISSSGLRVFISLLKRVTRVGGKLTLQHVNSNVKSVLDLTGFSSLFTIE